MTNCPKCGTEISRLTCYREASYDVELSAEGEPVYSDRTSSLDPTRYECPDCGEVLFTAQRKAIKFLKGD